MRFETRIGIAIVILGAMIMVIGSAGFTSTQADRNVTVSIVEDGDAYVGLGPTDDGGRYDGDVNASITEAELEPLSSDVNEIEYREEKAAFVTNQFTTSLDLRIDIERTSGDEEYPKLRYEFSENASTGDTNGSINEAWIPTGEEAVFDAFVTCRVVHEDDGTVSVSDDQATFDVTFSVEGIGVSADVTREVHVNCDGVTLTKTPTLTPNS
jgi:hypothetical protein